MRCADSILGDIYALIPASFAFNPRHPISPYPKVADMEKQEEGEIRVKDNKTLQDQTTSE